MSAEKEGEKTNAAKELEIFIKGLKTDKASLLNLVNDVMPIAYNLAALVSEASKNNFAQLGQFKEEEREDMKKFAKKILQKLNRATGIEPPPKGHVVNP